MIVACPYDVVVDGEACCGFVHRLRQTMAHTMA